MEQPLEKPLLYINENNFFDSLYFYLEKQAQLNQKENQLQVIEKQLEHLIVNEQLTQTYKREIYLLTKKINKIKAKSHELHRNETGVFHYLIRFFNHSLRTACIEELKLTNHKLSYFHQQIQALQPDSLFEEYLHEKQRDLRKECTEIQNQITWTKTKFCHFYFRFLTNQKAIDRMDKFLKNTD